MKKTRWRAAAAVAAALVLTLVAPAAAQAALATGGKFLGNVIHAPRVPSSYAALWNQVTPENHAKWALVEPTRDSPQWGPLDGIYDYAASQGMPVRYHTLVWGSDVPAWLAALPPEEQRAEVEEWIAEAGARYDTRTAVVDVVNEPLHAPPAYAASLGGAGSTGYDWVIWAFERARAAFPHAQLALNEYDVLSDVTLARRYTDLVGLLKARGLIDVVGVQAHFLDQVKTSSIKAGLAEVAKTGLPVHVTELDIEGTDRGQLKQYQEKFPVLWTHPAVRGVTLWGYEEGRIWARRGHLVRADGSERPALSWLRSYLASAGA